MHKTSFDPSRVPVTYSSRLPIRGVVFANPIRPLAFKYDEAPGLKKISPLVPPPLEVKARSRYCLIRIVRYYGVMVRCVFIVVFLFFFFLF